MKNVHAKLNWNWIAIIACWVYSLNRQMNTPKNIREHSFGYVDVMINIKSKAFFHQRVNLITLFPPVFVK